MRKLAAFALPLLLILAFAATGCGKGGGGSDGSGGGNTVQLDAANFAVSSITIHAGDTLKWVNPASGTTHLLCLGENMSCDKNIKDGPSDLSNGTTLEVDPGDTKSSTFPTKGDFKITCTVHTNMDMVVHVQ
jgi:plastocyanin